MNVLPIKAFSDNYIWLLTEGREAVVVDPGAAEGVLEYLKEQGLQLIAILLTHEHNDHTGGVRQLTSAYPGISVFGPAETLPLAVQVVAEGNVVELWDKEFQVLLTAGHTAGHISYVSSDLLFCGDALFSGGCGRVFTGDYQAQYAALQKFKQLAGQTKVYAAHEYTETNLRFAHEERPNDEAIQEALEETKNMRALGLPTLPSTIDREREINLFLQADSLEEFMRLRKARDRF